MQRLLGQHIGSMGGGIQRIIEAHRFGMHGGNLLAVAQQRAGFHIAVMVPVVAIDRILLCIGGDRFRHGGPSLL